MIDVDFGSSRYDELVELRYKVLLEPLGLKFLDMYREKEMNYLHIGCVESLDDNLVGGLMLVPVNDEEIRLMQVAVDSKYQREGVGREMVKYAENAPGKRDIHGLSCMRCCQSFILRETRLPAGRRHFRGKRHYLCADGKRLVIFNNGTVRWQKLFKTLRSNLSNIIGGCKAPMN